MTRIDEFLLTADPSQQILVSDSGNDQTLVTSVWKVLHRTGREVVMSGAFAGRCVGEVFPVVTAVAELVCKDGFGFATTHLLPIIYRFSSWYRLALSTR